MSNDTELFELCKEVYKRTGWERDDYNYGGKVEKYEHRYGLEAIYTSDYLLGKLPPVVQDNYDKKFRHIQMWINGDAEARACYVEPYDKEFRGAYPAKSDEMRKTLLKLTIELDDAGELSHV